MSRVTVCPDSLTRELSRLHRLEIVALAEHDVPTFAHARLRWCELIITLCPGLAAGAPALARRLAPLLPDPPKPVPRWKLEVLARPLVPIVRRTIHTETLPGGRSYQTAVEQLACGHTRHVIVLLDGDLRGRRRRCKECGDARLAARACRELTEPGTPVALGVGKLVRKGGRGESPEHRDGAALQQPRPRLVVSR
jgi:hypothetical protein